MARDWRILNAIVDLRRTAADVVTIADAIVYAESETAKAAAIRLLPGRIRALKFRASRCLTALEDQGCRG